MVHADHALALSIERSVMRDLERYASVCARLDESLHVATEHVAGGLAVYIAPGSPANAVYGAGLEGPVDPADLERIERFYAARHAGAAISLCPLADPSLALQLGARGWVLTDFENVLIAELRPSGTTIELPVSPADITVRLAETAEQRAEWAHLSVEAYCAPEHPSREVARLARACAAREDVTLLIASLDGVDAGVGALWVDGEYAWVLGDATRQEHRGCGVQSALLAERMRLATRLGCEFALAEVDCGSGSQRNMEQLGFRVAYTRAQLVTRVA